MSMPIKKPRREVWVDLADDWRAKDAEIVGRVVIAFGQLEHLLFLTPHRIDGKGRYKDYWTRNGETTSVPEKIKRIREEHLRRFGRGINRHWSKLLTEIEQELNQERNRIVHGLWGKVNGKPQIRRLGRGLKVTPRKWKRLLKRIQIVRDAFEGEFWNVPPNIKKI
jgi:hypothetical protein